jgi:hypothetical protein
MEARGLGWKLREQGEKGQRQWPLCLVRQLLKLFVEATTIDSLLIEKVGA